MLAVILVFSVWLVFEGVDGDIVALAANVVDVTDMVHIDDDSVVDAISSLPVAPSASTVNPPS